MKKLLTYLCYGILILVIREDAPLADKLLLREKYYTVLNDTRHIDWQDMGHYHHRIATNIHVGVVMVNEDQLVNLHVDLDNVTQAKFDEWKNANLSEPDKFEAVRRDTINEAHYYVTNTLNLVRDE